MALILEDSWDSWDSESNAAHLIAAIRDTDLSPSSRGGGDVVAQLLLWFVGPGDCGFEMVRLLRRGAW